MGRILVVDNSIEVCEALARRVGDLGHKVETCLTGMEARRLVQMTAFDLILFELSLGDVSGVDLFEQIRTSPTNWKTPVIVLMDTLKREELSRVYGLGVVAVLAKPFPFRLLAEKIALAFNPNLSVHGALDPLVIKIFLEATISIFDTVANIHLNADKPFIKSGNIGLAEISAVIELDSEKLKGFMTVSMEERVLLQVLTQMFGDNVEQASDKSSLKDCCGELANQILGLAKQKLVGQFRLSFKTSVPSIVFGKDHILDYRSSLPVLVIPFRHENNSVYVEFSLELNDNQADPLGQNVPTQESIEGGDIVFF